MARCNENPAWIPDDKIDWTGTYEGTTRFISYNGENVSVSEITAQIQVIKVAQGAYRVVAQEQNANLIGLAIYDTATKQHQIVLVNEADVAHNTFVATKISSCRRVKKFQSLVQQANRDPSQDRPSFVMLGTAKRLY